MSRIYDIITKDQIKTWLKVESDTEDDFFDELAAAISDVVESYTDKIFVTRQLTEYYDGMGRNEVQLKYYPVYSIVSLNDDPDRDFGSTDEIAGTDYLLYSEYGVVKLFNDESNFIDALQNVKVIYKAGYSRFNIQDERNNYIDFIEGAGSTGTLSAEITAGIYDAPDAATQLQSALNGTGSLTFTVTYDFFDKKFTTTAPSSFSILWNTGTNRAKNCADIFGFERSGDSSAITGITSQFVRSGIPEDILLCAKKLSLRFKKESGRGDGIQEIKREMIAQGGTREFIKNDLPDDVKMVLNRYKRGYL
jgi:hypothetical protein